MQLSAHFHLWLEKSFRLLYSNDGLIFVTYDHYATFYEIDTEGIL